jgi:hemoglobin-like flavoprotein
VVTETQVQLVQSSWLKVLPIKEQAAALFYENLFTLDPKLKLLFKKDMVEQGAKLVQMIDVAVRGLSRLETIVPAVQAMGERHAGYGVEERDYATVASALLTTLGQGLGDDFTPDIKQAWTDVYQLLAKTMYGAA